MWCVRAIDLEGSGGVRGSFSGTTPLRCFALTGAPPEPLPEGGLNDVFLAEVESP